MCPADCQGRCYQPVIPRPKIMLRATHITIKVMPATRLVIMPASFECNHPINPIETINMNNAVVTADVPIVRIAAI
jgi:hypothetical protein